MKILIINHYSGNKGDRAVLYFLITALHDMGYTEVTVSTSNRKLYAQVNDVYKYDVKYIPWGKNEEFNASSKFQYYWSRIRWRFYRKIAFPIVNWLCCNDINIVPPFFCNKEFRRHIKKAEIVISTGGHHLTTRFYPNGNCAMIYDLILTKLFKKRYIIWSQTFGPFNYTSKICQCAMKKIIDGASTVFVRDLHSKIDLHEIGIDYTKMIDSYESVMGLADVVTPYVNPSRREKIIGMTVYNAERRSPEEHAKYVREVSAIGDFCCELGYHIRFFSHEMRGAVIDDRPLIKEIVRSMKNGNVSIEEDDYNTVDHLRAVAKCCMFIGHKTHSVVFGLATGTPMLALAYHPKTVDFMKMYDLSENCLLENDLSKVPLVLSRMLDNLDSIGLKQYNTSVAIRKKLQSDLAMALK